MQSYTRHVLVDGVPRDAVQFEFAKQAFFVVLITASYDEWLEFSSQTIDSIWLYALPSADVQNSQPNAWKIAIELKSTKMVTLELYDTNEACGTVFLVRTYTDDPNAASLSGWKNLTSNSVSHAGRRINAGVTLKDIILKVQAVGLLTYQLKDGRGRRFWASMVLSTIGQFIYEPVSYMLMHREADELMRRCWVQPNKAVSGYGFKDEPDNRLNIAEGQWRRPSTQREGS
ncbi:uncharacterized protein F4807DRAFT_472964 [Annulohypoxylon truncatum]|uniref:uncharacterized protein n=1 Tax=Annulohypoxylon truncatum TaxID=327061 RepID=UPI002007DAF6|nr:uncharacterized protein F4807DRAFT_472964 [Annulohypoxylon truncatum]KAI1211505.1 hypothetical protein F4807DRAFT_472964 [Annulohypoxylon truncatum]